MMITNVQNINTDPREIELYIHIPFCVKKCDYCDFLSGPYDEQVQKEYTLALCQEIIWQSKRVFGRVTSIYIGGGTPSWLPVKLMENIMDTVRKNFDLDPLAEVTIEANPGTVTREAANIYRSIGINRISVGLQSAHNDELELLGRIHTYDRFLRTYEILRQAGFENINVDLMTGLPGQTPGKLIETIRRVSALRPEHISSYALIIEEGTPFYSRYRADDIRQKNGQPTMELPNEDQAYELMKRAQQELIAHGFCQYEISNYSKPGKECRHNIGYWTRKTYVGMGAGAASLIAPACLVPECEGEEAGGMGLEQRISNIRYIYDYIEEASHLMAIDPQSDYRDVPIYDAVQTVTRKGAMEEFMFLGLRQTAGITAEAFYQAFETPIERVYQAPLQQLKQEGLLETREGRIYLTEQGLDLSNYALSKFLF